MGSRKWPHNGLGKLMLPEQQMGPTSVLPSSLFDYQGSWRPSVAPTQLPSRPSAADLMQSGGFITSSEMKVQEMVAMPVPPALNPPAESTFMKLLWRFGWIIPTGMVGAFFLTRRK